MPHRRARRVAPYHLQTLEPAVCSTLHCSQRTRTTQLLGKSMQKLSFSLWHRLEKSALTLCILELRQEPLLLEDRGSKR